MLSYKTIRILLDSPRRLPPIPLSITSFSMSKLSRILQFSRSQMFQKRLFGEDTKESLLFSHRAWMSTARTNFSPEGKLSDRVFADYSIFKGKGALSVSPILPTFSKLDSGDLKIDRRGSIMLTFRPAIGERKYDSEKKQLFALSATEVGSFISLSPGESCEFFHDPSMLSSNAGQVRKSLSIKPLGDGSGYFISLSVVNNILKTNERVTVPVTTAEFAVMREAFSFALPHILGWAAGCTNQISSSKQESHPKAFLERMDSEWDR